VGSTEGSKIEAYVASQLRQHPQKTTRLTDQFRDLQIIQPDVDLSKPRFTAHGRFSCNLHIVLVHDWRLQETRRDVWVGVRNIIRDASVAKGHLLSRVGIVPDHLHLTLGTNLDESPGDVALSYMNNVAYAHGMRPVLMHSCYLAGFGRYNLGAIRDE
jgi:hypothetical protein